MGAFLLKFFAISVILGGVLKAYIDVPMVHSNPKTVAAILIVLVLIAIWLLPRIGGWILKLLFFAAVVCGIGYVLYWLFGFTFGLVKSVEPKAEHMQTTEEIAQPQLQSIASYEGQKITDVVSEVRSGYLIRVGNAYVKLYGIDAPDPSQTCKDKRGMDYACGDMAIEYMRRLVIGKAATCQPVGGDSSGNYIGTCNVAGADVGATMAYNGWALANRNESKVYIPYEKAAYLARRGLWEGKFMAPWDWRVLNRPQPKSQPKKKGFFSW